jgi:hypothetical protein
LLYKFGVDFTALKLKQSNFERNAKTILGFEHFSRDIEKIAFLICFSGKSSSQCSACRKMAELEEKCSRMINDSKDMETR